MSRIVVVAVLYFLILLAAHLLPEGISDYNAYVLLCMCAAYVLLIRSADVYISSFVCCLALCAVSLLRAPLYTFIDCALIFFIFGSLHIGLFFPVKKRELRFLKYGFFFVYLLSLLGILNPSLYRGEGDELRYEGLFHAINFSASVFAMLGIAVWEIEKTSRKNTAILLILVAGLLIYIWATSTRSLLFALPYWLFQLFRRCNKTVLVTGLVVVGIFFLPLVVDTISSKLRLEENESSMATRSMLYLRLLSGIMDNYAIIPHGSHSATDMIVRFTGDSRFSPHNDFLTFIYDWGVIFYVFCAMIITRLRRSTRFSLEFCLILLTLVSCALHNMMFAIYIWIPFAIILMVRRNENNVTQVR